jgi:hypothetical protein
MLKREKVHTFSRTYAPVLNGAGINAPSIVAPTAADYVGAYYFSLGLLPGPSDFTTLFDQYRFIQISVSIIPNAGVGTGSAPLLTAIDYDDASLPSAVSDLYQYDSVQYSQPGNVIVRTFTPRVALAVYSGAFTSFASASNNLWLDVASPNTQYYGFKVGISAVGGASANWNVLVNVILQCRNSR